MSCFWAGLAMMLPSENGCAFVELLQKGGETVAHKSLFIGRARVILGHLPRAVSMVELQRPAR